MEDYDCFNIISRAIFRLVGLERRRIVRISVAGNRTVSSSLIFYGCCTNLLILVSGGSISEVDRKVLVSIFCWKNQKVHVVRKLLKL